MPMPPGAAAAAATAGQPRPPRSRQGAELKGLYVSRWPTARPADPWAIAYKNLFQHARTHKVLFTARNPGSSAQASLAVPPSSSSSSSSSSSGGGGGGGGAGGEWIAAEDAVVVTEEDDHEGGASSGTKAGAAAAAAARAGSGVGGVRSLRAILVADGLPVVALPLRLKQALVEQRAVRGEAGPAFVRSHFRTAAPSDTGSPSGGGQGQHPCLDPLRAEGGAPGATANALVLLATAVADLEPFLAAAGALAKNGGGHNGGNSGGAGEASGALRIAGPSGGRKETRQWLQLAGLGFLPLADGSLGTLQARDPRWNLLRHQSSGLDDSDDDDDDDDDDDFGDYHEHSGGGPGGSDSDDVADLDDVGSSSIAGARARFAVAEVEPHLRFLVDDAPAGRHLLASLPGLVVDLAAVRKGARAAAAARAGGDPATPLRGRAAAAATAAAAADGSSSSDSRGHDGDFDSGVEEAGMAAAVEAAALALRCVAESGALNVLHLSAPHLAGLLGRLLPEDWAPDNLARLQLDEVRGGRAEKNLVLAVCVC
jgi:hypothetical protein